jgi:hypothetical protein
MWHARTWAAAVMQVLTFEEQTCDPELRDCAQPQFVWEVKCTHCDGTGYVRTNGGGRARRGGRHGAGRRAPLASCARCSGVGYVRHASTMPDDTLEEAYVTLGRESADAVSAKPRDGKRPSLAKAITAVNIIGSLYNKMRKPEAPM